MTAAAGLALAFPAATASAQTTVTLDGTSGSNSISTAYTLSGNTTFDLGFFADYLVVGGGGGGGVIRGGGGGGGGVLEGSGLELTASTTITGGGGGGSAGAAASGSGGSAKGGVGGAGLTSSITGAAVPYGGGGGGMSADGTFAAGGSGGGGRGASNLSTLSDRENGTANTGGGGGGGNNTGGSTGGTGGSGIVILRYAGDATGISGGSTDTATVPGEAITRFNTSGTFGIDLNARLGATLTQPVAGTGTFTFAGPGRLTLAADCTFVGDTIVSASTLQVGDAGTTGSLGSGNVTNDAALVFNRSNTLAVAGGISGSGSLTQSGSGTLTLAGSNTYVGDTTITAGTLEVTGSLGGGSYAGGIANAGILRFDTGGMQTLTGSLTSTGTLDLASGTNVVFDTTASTGVANTITGAGSVTKQGAGRLVLRGTNTYSGGTTISAGAIEAADSSALGSGSLTLSGGSLLANPGVTLANPITLSGAAANVRLGNLLGVEFVLVAGGGGGGGDNGGGGGGGGGPANDVNVSSAGGAGGGGAGNLGTGSNGTDGLGGGGGGAGVSGASAQGGNGGDGIVVIRYLGGQQATGGSITSGTGTAAGYTLHTFTSVGSAPFALTGGAVTLSGDITGTGGFTYDTDSTLVLTGANTYQGDTIVSAGTLIGSVSSIPGNVANGSVLEFAQAVDATFAAVVSGAGSVTKSGAGNLSLSTAQTYTGATSVAAGRLSVNAALASTAVTVSGGTLGGSGSIAGTVAVQNGATLSPGNSIESLSAGATSFASGATFAYEVDSQLLGNLAAAADLQVVNSNLDIASGAVLSFTDLNPSPAAFVENSTIFALFNYSGTWNGGVFTYNGTPLADGSRFSVGSQLWEIDYNSTTAGLNFTSDYVGSNFVTVTAVPEPTTLVLLAAGLGLAALASRHRK